MTANNTLQQLASAVAQGGVRIVDLSVTLRHDTPILQLPEQFNQGWPFRKEEISRYDERGPAWYWNNISCGEHTGTHFDAPIHWVTGKDFENNATDTVDPQQFVAPACVIDCTAYAAEDEDFLLQRSHVEAWERDHGRIPAGHWVLFQTRWSDRTDPDAFLNMREDGAHTPGPSHEVVKFLAEERDVLGFGTETVGTDAGQAPQMDPPFPCHNVMHGTNKFGLASLTNLDQLPPTGALIVAAPLKIEEGSGSPCRVIALVGGN
ncbi:cyclase family protein [Arhodomonas sp. SL1]|uniref:cyclase family protein n=1 Tax=Arhodomonas sp. SL1 TaxID=3425691 RepID=UPI003F8814AA